MDPGSYRIHMLLAYSAQERGRCESARAHADAARRLFPNNPAPKQLLSECRSGPRSAAAATR